MVFSSITFLFLFFPAVLIIYLIVPQRLQNLFLMTVSLIFYFWGEAYLIWIMLTTIVINYISALYIEAHLDKEGNCALTGLILSVAANLLLLGYFKYAGFFMDNFNLLIHLLNPESASSIQSKEILLPIGLSFYTFGAMSYTIDVYRREVKATHNLVDFSCYVSFFPQLLAGPIVRYSDIQTQLRSHKMSCSYFSEGVFRFVVGLAKKVLIADTVAQVADAAFSLPSYQLGTAFAWLGCLCYTLQIYFDFSGYSDMAIGLGRMFGFRFMENFNYPYVADSIQEFWRRWHISLSTWFKDYLYIPLGGNKRGKYRTYFNIMTVFFLCGLWHGASWNFVLWGGYYGCFLVMERMGVNRILTRLHVILRHIYVIVIVMAGWVLFRAETLTQALTYLKIMAGFSSPTVDNLYEFALYCDLLFTLTFITAIIASMPIMNSIRSIFNSLYRVNCSMNTCCSSKLHYAVGVGFNTLLQFCHVAGYMYISILFLLSVITLSSGAYNPFIYFKF